MILEEDFDKNGEPWYNQQDLEHGKGFWSHPKLCVGWQILRAPERHQLHVKCFDCQFFMLIFYVLFKGTRHTNGLSDEMCSDVFLFYQ